MQTRDLPLHTQKLTSSPSGGTQSTLPPPQMGHCLESLTINISVSPGLGDGRTGGIAFPPDMSGNLSPWTLLTHHVTLERHLLHNYFISYTEWLLSFHFFFTCCMKGGIDKSFRTRPSAHSSLFSLLHPECWELTQVLLPVPGDISPSSPITSLLCLSKGKIRCCS